MKYVKRIVLPEVHYFTEPMLLELFYINRNMICYQNYVTLLEIHYVKRIMLHNQKHLTLLWKYVIILELWYVRGNTLH